MRIIAFLLIFSVFGGLVLADGIYTQQSTSVSSATVPANVLPSALRESWCIKPRSTGAVPVICFSYQGAIPTAVPTASAVYEIAPGQPLCDALGGEHADVALNEAWACVLSTGVTAVTVDSTWR